MNQSMKQTTCKRILTNITILVSFSILVVPLHGFKPATVKSATAFILPPSSSLSPSLSSSSLSLQELERRIALLPSLTTGSKNYHDSSTSASRIFSSFSHETFFNNLDVIYTEASTSIRCPFIKRRVADTLDNIAMIVRFLIIRHKSLWPRNWMNLERQLLDDENQEDYMQVPGCKAAGRHIQIDHHTGKSVKNMNLPLDVIQNIIIQDWSTHNDKGYYVTGKLNSTIYRDDCYFDGPDPDMPVRGLRKYLGAASHLFDSNQSYAKLKDVNIIQLESAQQVIEVKWRMEGVLMLPWRPKVKPWSGWTRYHLDEHGLIEYHQEGWDISVMEAFVGTLFPTLGDKIWKSSFE